MAKTKRKSRRSTSSVFYEAIPATSLPQVGLTDVSLQLHDTVRTVEEIWAALRARLWPATRRLYHEILQTGLATSEIILVRLRTGFFAAYYAGDATITYGPAAAADILAAAGRLRRRLASRRARALYLSSAGVFAISLVVVGSLSAAATLRAYAHDISSPSALLAKKKTGTTILDRNGQVLFEGYGAQVGTVVPLKDIPAALKNATLAAEDPSFYDHPGFSWRGTMRAAVTDLMHLRRDEGGSTLTQQLVKNALLTSDKKFQRKYQELLLSMELERHYSKDQILEMYLNEVYYGQGAAGVEAASQTYFHKPTSQLSLGESALLAGLPLGPSRFDPNVDLEGATGRRNFVLSRMAELGQITPAQAQAAAAQPIALATNPAPPAGGLTIYAKTIKLRAPHFVFYILNELRARYGDDLVETGGLTVRTTLDLSKQDLAQQTVQTQISRLAYNHVTNGGLVSIEPATGDIVAMVGSIDYNAPGFGAVNVTLSQLQPGSSFKPFAYATAFKKGWTGATTIEDTPFSAPNGDGTLYVPQNYDGRFHGTVTVRRALDNSLNIPAVKTLQFAGIHDTIQTAHDLGITSLQDESRFGLALVLGGGEVRPLDMAAAYATFAHDGVKVTPRSILKVSDRYGTDITGPQPKPGTSVLDSRIAYMITNILADNAARQPEFPFFSPLHLSRPAAAKTGTTNDFRDNWTVGYTPQLATAVWVGNNDHTAMNNVDGITGAAPIWHDFMEGALASQPVLDFTPPPGITMAKVCADGGLANPWDAGFTEVFMTSALPARHCATTMPRPQPQPAPEPTPDLVGALPPITLPEVPVIRFPKPKPPTDPFN